MVQFNNISALCKMNKPAGLVFWQQQCTLHRGTHGLRSTAEVMTHNSPRLEDEPDDVLCIQTACLWGRLENDFKGDCLGFFLQLGVPFCSRDVVSVANPSLYRH